MHTVVGRQAQKTLNNALNLWCRLILGTGVAYDKTKQKKKTSKNKNKEEKRHILEKAEFLISQDITFKCLTVNNNKTKFSWDIPHAKEKENKSIEIFC